MRERTRNVGRPIDRLSRLAMRIDKVAEFGEDRDRTDPLYARSTTGDGRGKAHVDRGHDAEQGLIGIELTLFLGLQAGANARLQRNAASRIKRRVSSTSLSRSEDQQLEAARMDRPGIATPRNLLIRRVRDIAELQKRPEAATARCGVHIPQAVDVALGIAAERRFGCGRSMPRGKAPCQVTTPE